MTPIRVVIDTDPGIDDAAAILMAFGSPELEVLGLTAVAGNVGLPKTTVNALRIVDLAGVDVPVAAGADQPLVRASAERMEAESVHGEDGVGGCLPGVPNRQVVDEHAIDLIARLAADEPITLVAIGPLTNVAMLLARYPEVVGRIERLLIMGGARLEGNATAAAEFNIWLDPEAAARVFASDIPITIFPLDITRQAILTGGEVAEIAASGPVGAALAAMIRFYDVGEHEAAFGDFLSPLHDVLTTLALVDPDAMTTVDAALTVDCGDSISRGATLVNTSDRVVKNARVGVTLDRERFARELIARVRRLDGQQ